MDTDAGYILDLLILKVKVIKVVYSSIYMVGWGIIIRVSYRFHFHMILMERQHPKIPIGSTYSWVISIIYPSYDQQFGVCTMQPVLDLLSLYQFSVGFISLFHILSLY